MGSDQTAGLEFAALGPLAVTRDGRQVDLGGSKPRALLEVLLMSAGRLVRTDALVDALWNVDSPSTATKTIQKYVSHLRKQIGDVIVTRPGGYLLQVTPRQVDALHFENLVDRARDATSAEESAILLHEALSLWRGDPYPDVVHGDQAAAERMRLEERRISATEELMDAELRLGRHAQLVGRLEQLVAHNPLRERLWSQLMVALYRSGRQGDALNAYQRVRRTLVDELGIEPSPNLQDLERRILAHDASLAVIEDDHTDKRRYTGTLTFLLADIAESSRLWTDEPSAMVSAIERFAELVNRAVATNGGRVVRDLGERMLSVFGSAGNAVAAAVEVQLGGSQIEIVAQQLRIAVYSGDADSEAAGDFGRPLAHCSRLVRIGHARQTLLHETTAALVREGVAASVTVRDLGSHRLLDATAAERIYQLVHPELPNDFLPLRGAIGAPTNVPRQLTSFVGREEELRDLARLLVEARLVTLTGPAGSGKTRLALQAGLDTDRHPDGVWLIELAALASPDDVPNAFTAPFRLGEQPGRSTDAVLVDFFAHKELLLIVDNCEHLVTAIADLGAEILRAAPGVRLLATSREPLGIAGEVTYEVTPLGVPDSEVDLERIQTFDSVRLFLERARSADPRFALTVGNSDYVAQICRRLDGIPLAVELAAALTRTFDPRRLSELLEDRFDLLSSAPRTAPARHRTLRAAIDWSYDSLTEAERRLFCRLSIFQGQFDLEAVEQVCGNSPLSETDVLVLLPRLVDKSLVVAVRRPDGGTRYRLLETLRDYGRRQLDARDEVDVRRRHSEYFMGLTEQAERAAMRPTTESWNIRHSSHYDNVRAALRWSIESGDIETGLRLAAAIFSYSSVFWFWDTSPGSPQEGLAWLEKGLARSAGVTDSVRAKALVAAGFLAEAQGSHEQATSFAEQALALYQGLGDELGTALATHMLGSVAHYKGEYDRANELLTSSLASYTRLGETWLAAWGLHRLGMVARLRGRYERAQALHEESLSLFCRMGDDSRAAYSLWMLGVVARYTGDYQRARERCEESLRLFTELGERSGIAHVRTTLGDVARLQGDYQSAVDLYEEGRTELQEIGDRRCVASSLANLGAIAHLRADHVRARALYEESLKMRQETGDMTGIAESLVGLARVEAELGQDDQAAVLLGAAEALRDAGGAALPAPERSDYDRFVESLRTRLGAEGLQEVWSRGRELSTDAVINLALRS